MATVALLDWNTFFAAYFPGRRRHGLESLVAYDAYRRSGGLDTPKGDAAGDSAALDAWEDEGGPAR